MPRAAKPKEDKVPAAEKVEKVAKGKVEKVVAAKPKEPKVDKAPKEKAAAKPAAKVAKEDKPAKGDKPEKKKKDPNAPKGVSGPYIWFCQDKRASVKEGLPDGASIGDIGKALGELWKTVTDAEKKKYNLLAEKDKERHAKEMAAYKPE